MKPTHPPPEKERFGRRKVNFTVNFKGSGKRNGLFYGQADRKGGGSTLMVSLTVKRSFFYDRPNKYLVKTVL